MRTIPAEYRTPCSTQGTVTSLSYGEKFTLLYTPAVPAGHILYLIHGGGGDQHDFFTPECLNMIDHMIADGVLKPLYISPRRITTPMRWTKARLLPASRWPDSARN